MQKFTVSFSRNPITVAILLTVPLLVAAIFIGPLVYFPQTPDWLVLLVSGLMLWVAVLCVKFIIRKWGSVDANVEMDERGVAIRLLRRSLFYSRKEYVSSWEGVENVSTNYDAQHDVRFYTIRFRQPSMTFVLTPAEELNSEMETAFGEILMGHVSRFNAQTAAKSGQQIRQRGFYESWWAKGITIGVYLMIACATIIRFTAPERVSTWRLLQLLCIAVVWLGVYYGNRMGRKA